MFGKNNFFFKQSECPLNGQKTPQKTVSSRNSRTYCLKQYYKFSQIILTHQPNFIHNFGCLGLFLIPSMTVCRCSGNIIIANYVIQEIIKLTNTNYLFKNIPLNQKSKVKPFIYSLSCFLPKIFSAWCITMAGQLAIASGKHFGCWETFCYLQICLNLLHLIFHAILVYSIVYAYFEMHFLVNICKVKSKLYA